MTRKTYNELLDAILALGTREEARRFLQDLLTENEREEFADRWRAARMLAAGIPYTAIAAETGLSSRTIARVAKWLRAGAGGYRTLIHRLPEQRLEGK